VEERKQEKRLQVLGPLAGGLTGRLLSKNETASKVADSQVVSQRWTLKTVFRFFHSALVRVPKTFAFLLFPLTSLFPFSLV